MNFRKTLGLVGVLVLFIYLPNVYAQDNGQAELKNILEKSSEKILSINAASYKAFYRSDDEPDDEPVIINGNIYFKNFSTTKTVRSE